MVVSTIPRSVLFSTVPAQNKNLEWEKKISQNHISGQSVLFMIVDIDSVVLSHGHVKVCSSPQTRFAIYVSPVTLGEVSPGVLLSDPYFVMGHGTMSHSMCKPLAPRAFTDSSRLTVNQFAFCSFCIFCSELFH